MHRSIALAAVLAMAACSSPRLPPPNTAQAVFDRREGVVQVTVSSVVPPTGVFLVSALGARYQAPGLSLLSSPHVAYNPPPSLGLGIGGFGFGSGVGFGSGIGVGVPVGHPTVSEVSDQYIVSALIPLPPDYTTNWSNYHVEVLSGGPPTVLTAPAPGSNA
jgi:hypothetical protein